MGKSCRRVLDFVFIASSSRKPMYTSVDIYVPLASLPFFKIILPQHTSPLPTPTDRLKLRCDLTSSLPFYFLRLLKQAGSIGISAFSHRRSCNKQILLEVWKMAGLEDGVVTRKGCVLMLTNRDKDALLFLSFVLQLI